MTTIKERFESIARKYGLSDRQLGAKLGKSAGFIHKMSATTSSDVLSTAVDIFPEINLYWLVTGKGAMLVSESSDELVNFLKVELKETQQDLLAAKVEIAVLKQEVSGRKRDETSDID